MILSRQIIFFCVIFACVFSKKDIDLNTNQCSYSKWKAEGPCVSNCTNVDSHGNSQGVQEIKRTLLFKDNKNPHCQKTEKKLRKCLSTKCPVDCRYSDWEGDCNGVCNQSNSVSEIGKAHEFRTMIPAKNGGQPCIIEPLQRLVQCVNVCSECRYQAKRGCVSDAGCEQCSSRITIGHEVIYYKNIDSHERYCEKNIPRNVTLSNKCSIVCENCTEQNFTKKSKPIKLFQDKFGENNGRDDIFKIFIGLAIGAVLLISATFGSLFIKKRYWNKNVSKENKKDSLKNISLSYDDIESSHENPIYQD